MEESVRLGRIAGIPVGINWSLLVIFWLITWGLAEGRLPDQFPGHAAGSYWVAAAVTAVLFYGSLLAHELGHALVGRRHGLGVEGITLWLFGGVAWLGGETASPQAEVRIAAVGPLVSFGVAAIAGAAAVALDSVGAGEHALRNRFSAFPVVDADGRLTGLVTLTRIKAVPPERRSETHVRDISRPLAQVPTAAPHEPLVDLLARLVGDVDGRALVLDDDQLVGNISPTDVARTVEWTMLSGPHPNRYVVR